MQHHEKYSRTIRRSESGLRCGCAAVAAVLACVAPGYARHNRVTVTTYGDAAGTAARAERLETIMECTPTEGHTAVWNYAYDLAGRQTSVSLAVDGGSASTVATYTYDGVGRLASKSFGTVGNGTSEEYVYDARSNVTGVSGSGFAQTAYFGTNPVEGGASRYLSPCAASERQYGAEGEGVSQTMWTYRYDGFGRLAEASATDAVSAPDRALGEVFEYDRNSNILSLERVYAGEPVQDAAMSYVGNRLTGVNDASMPYNKDIVPSFAAGTYALEYDGDGRLVADGTRGITDIKYTTDGIGLPTRIDLSADNKVYSSYLPDGTLIARDFRSVRTRTTVRVNSKGDTIVRTIREPVIDRTLYRGDWEISGSVWRLNTPEGIARVVKNTSTSDAQGGASAGRTFTHLWYVRDRLGSVRTVLDDEGAIRQCTMYYPSGLPVQLFGTERVSDRAHIGNRWSNFAGLGWHDNTARWHDAILDRFTDPTGMDIHRYDETGNYIETITNSEGVDTVQIGHYADGEFIAKKSETLSANGALKRFFDTTDGENALSYITIRGDENAYKIFKLFADVTGVERTLVQTGISGDKGLNFICTSLEEDTNSATPNLYNNMLLFGYTLRSQIHNHPQGTELPSGIPGRTMPQTGGGDIKVAQQITEYSGQTPSFYIYIKGKGLIRYTPYYPYL